MEEKQEKMRSGERLLELPMDTLELLCNRLSIKDQIRLGSTCKSLHSVAFKRHNPQAREYPWLISPFYCFRRKYMLLSCSPYHACYDMTPSPTASSESNSHIVGSSKGWLCLQIDFNIHILNLFSKLRLDLPPLTTLRHYPDEFNNDAELSAKAFAMSFCNNMRPTNVVAVVAGSLGSLGLCKARGTTWKLQDEGYANVSFHNAKLYAVTKRFNMVDIFNVVVDDDDDVKLCLVGSIEYEYDSPPLPKLASFIHSPPSYLVESQGSLLLVKRYLYRYHSLGHLPSRVDCEVFKVEDDDGRDPPRLVKVDTLEDQILLLSDSCAECVDTKDCPDSNVFKGNHIYLVGYYNTLGFEADVVDCSFKDKSVTRLRLSVDMKGIHWMLPRFAAQCYCKAHSN